MVNDRDMEGGGVELEKLDTECVYVRSELIRELGRVN